MNYVSKICHAEHWPLHEKRERSLKAQTSCKSVGRVLDNGSAAKQHASHELMFLESDEAYSLPLHPYLAIV